MNQKETYKSFSDYVKKQLFPRVVVIFSCDQIAELERIMGCSGLKGATEYIDEVARDQGVNPLSYKPGDVSVELHTSDNSQPLIEQDIKFLISRWFTSLEDEGVDPWQNDECVAMANKYQYTMQDYQDFLRTLS